MRSPQHLVHSRTRLSERFALFPLEGFPPARLPNWNCDVKILAAPALGANFAQYLMEMPAQAVGYFAADERIETFYYVLSGDCAVQDGQAKPRPLRGGSFGIFPPGIKSEFFASDVTRLLILRKRYEPFNAFAIGRGAVQERGPMFDALHGHESTIEAAPWAGNPHARLQTLIPDERAYDLAMNIFTFDPGHGLPIVETHVMEHGLYFLQGKGLYFLNDQWMEVEQDDFIWMGPFCPQSFYATGTVPAKYLYYKNVNRDVTL